MKVNLRRILISFFVRRLHIGHSVLYLDRGIKSFVYKSCNGNCIIDLIQTFQHLELAMKLVRRVKRNNDPILFVSTNSKLYHSIKETAKVSRSYFSNYKRLRGLISNLATLQLTLLTLHRLKLEKKLGIWEDLPKKKSCLLDKRMRRIEHCVGGLEGIKGLPGAVLFVGMGPCVGLVKECFNLNIPRICILDTNCSPRFAKVVVPINDDVLSR